MSNNAFVTIDGDEIGRAQAVQAHASRIIPHVDMNPVLLKPEADHRSQVVVMGKPLATVPAAAYQSMKEEIWKDVTAALDRLRSQYDLVIIEGAGSPAEINLKARDISNMRVALHAEAPVLIAGDIDRGGVFAHLYGTHWLLDEAERALVKGFIINKLRGDPSLLEPGLTMIEELTGVPVLGVVPWIRHVRLPEEDSVALDRRVDASGPFDGVDVAVVRFPRIANFDDFDPLEAETSVRVRYVGHPSEFGDPDLVILPGTKATIADITWLRETGIAAQVLDAAARGMPIVGVCGGLQALGREVRDPGHVEGGGGGANGLGLLDLVTVFTPEKETRQIRATVTRGRGILAGADGAQLDGYEIHAGVSTFGDVAMASDDGRALGTVSDDGWVFGCYVHGLFASDTFRQAVLRNVAARRGKQYSPSDAPGADEAFHAVAEVLRSSLDLPRLFALVGR